MKKFIVLAAIAFQVIIGAAPALAGSIPSAPPGAPANPPTWYATLTATSGTDTDSPVINTSGACPSPARDIIGRIYGQGFPASGIDVIGNSSGGVSMKDPFEAPLLQSLRDTRVQQPQYQPYQGIYTIVVSCILPAYAEQSYGNYTVKIKFTNPSNWTALPPVSNVYGPVQLANGSYVPANSPQAQNRDIAPSPSASPSAGAPAGVGAAASTTAVSLHHAAAKSSSFGLGLTLMGVGIGIAGLVIFFFFRPRTR